MQPSLSLHHIMIKTLVANHTCMFGTNASGIFVSLLLKCLCHTPFTPRASACRFEDKRATFGQSTANMLNGLQERRCPPLCPCKRPDSHLLGLLQPQTLASAHVAVGSHFVAAGLSGGGRCARSTLAGSVLDLRCFCGGQARKP